MNLHYKFVKPGSFYSIPDEDRDVVIRFNTIGADSWDKSLKDDIGFEDGDISKRTKFKKEIKKHLIKMQENYCYYCGRSFFLFGENEKRFSRNIHIDHILPKKAAHGRYGRFTFEPQNLILACSICNGRDFKGSLDFCDEPSDDYDAMSFSIVHPYFENINQHFRIEDDGTAVKINRNKSKATVMERVFGINSTYMIESRLQNLTYIRQNPTPEEEDVITEITKNIPIDGIISQ
ncbi:TPA: HNH endonuclease [Enterobacter cloacae]